jgi:glycogen(starch) synthase
MGCAVRDADDLHIIVAGRAIAPQHGFGGLERATAHHLRALARRGVRLSVFTRPSDPAEPAPDDFGGQVTWHTIPYHRRALPLRANSIPDRLLHYPPFSRALGAAIADLCRREHVDVVHAHGLAGLGYAERSAVGGRRSAEERSGMVLDGRREAIDNSLPTADRRPLTPLPPLVLNPHGLEEFSRRDRAKWLAYAPFRWGVRRAARAAAAVIATDRALVAPIGRELDVSPARIALIPNGVDLAELDALTRPALTTALRARYRLGEAPLILVSVARLERNKGLHDGLAALGAIREELPAGWRWLIVGQGGEESALRAAIAEAELGANVALVGALPDAEVQSLLAAADLALIPSRYEGSSLTALEAMARGLPIVATAVGGLPDKVIPGQGGFLAPPADPAALATTLRAALVARPTWPALGEGGRRLVAARFSWDALAERYLALYRALGRAAA